MSEYGKGYIAKGALLDAVQWDNDIEKWVIWDNVLQSLMTEKNDVVEVTQCKDCVGKKACYIWGNYLDDDDFCSKGR